MKWQARVVVLCGASSLATSIAHVYSKQQLTIVSHQLTALQAWTDVSTLLGCLLSWIPLHYLGRRATLQLVVAPLLTAGCCLVFGFQYLARAVSSVLLLGISLQGAALGVGFSAVPVYLLETMCLPYNTYLHTKCAPALIVTTELSTAIGTLLAHRFPISPNTQYLHLIPATIIITSALALCLATESPRWLLLFGHRVEQAKASLHLLLGSGDQHHYICQALQMFQKEEEQFCTTRVNSIVVRTYLRSLTLAACLLSLPCVSGLYVYDFYLKWAFKFAGVIVNDLTISLSVLSTSIRVAAVGFAAAVFFVKDGVKFQCVSLISSTGIISIALCATGMLLFSLEHGENWVRTVPWLPLAIHLLFHTVFWFGVGSLTSITAFQFIPSPLRPSIFSLAGGLHWLLEMTFSKFLFFMIEKIHPFGTFWFYAGMTAIGLVLVVFMVVPEISRES